MAVPKGYKQLLLIIPESVHTKLKVKASTKKTTMTDMFIDWVESL